MPSLWHAPPYPPWLAGSFDFKPGQNNHHIFAFQGPPFLRHQRSALSLRSTYHNSGPSCRLCTRSLRNKALLWWTGSTSPSPPWFSALIKQPHASLPDIVSRSLPDQRNPHTIALMFFMQALSNIQCATKCHRVAIKMWFTTTTLPSRENFIDAHYWSFFLSLAFTYSIYYFLWVSTPTKAQIFNNHSIGNPLKINTRAPKWPWLWCPLLLFQLIFPLGALQNNSNFLSDYYKLASLPCR